MRPPASAASRPARSVDALDASDDASGTTVVPRQRCQVALLLRHRAEAARAMPHPHRRGSDFATVVSPTPLPQASIGTLRRLLAALHVVRRHAPCAARAAESAPVATL